MQIGIKPANRTLMAIDSKNLNPGFTIKILPVIF